MANKKPQVSWQISGYYRSVNGVYRLLFGAPLKPSVEEFRNYLKLRGLKAEEGDQYFHSLYDKTNPIKVVSPIDFEWPLHRLWSLNISVQDGREWKTIQIFAPNREVALEVATTHFRTAKPTDLKLNKHEIAPVDQAKMLNINPRMPFTDTHSLYIVLGIDGVWRYLNKEHRD